MPTPEHLRALRDRLLTLHKALLDAERAAYEQAHGPVPSSGEMLQLVIGHEQFTWLRAYSGLIVNIDEWIASDTRKADEPEALWQEAKTLTALGDTPDAVRYRTAVQASASAAMAHAAVRDLLDADQA